MKKIGLIGALPQEIAVLNKKLTNATETKNALWTYHSGQMHNKEVVIVQCGVGKVNAAIVAQHLINNMGVTAIINSGVAGAVSKDLDIGDIVVSNEVFHHDVDVRAFGYKRGQIPQFKVIGFPADPTLINIAKTSTNTIIGRIATGDQFVTSTNLQSITEIYPDTLCVEMEGAAIAQVCYLYNIPFVIIRSISDKADGGAAQDFSENLENSVAAYTGVVEKIIEEY